MKALQTGDLVFTRSPKLISRLIRLFSAPMKTMFGEYIPSHVGMIRVVHGYPHVQEALWGRGFVKSDWQVWIRAHQSEDVRVVHMPFTGKRVDIGGALEELEGTPYATLFELMRSVGDNNKDATKRDFCSAACQRTLEMAFGHKIKDLNRPDNTNPYELYLWADKHAGRIEKVKEVWNG